VTTKRDVSLQNKTHPLNNEIVVNALAGIIGVGITYIKDDEDILPVLKVAPTPALPCLSRTLTVLCAVLLLSYTGSS
jgi:hypothetical protein